MFIFKRKYFVPLYISIILISIFINSCNTYGLNAKEITTNNTSTVPLNSTIINQKANLSNSTTPKQSANLLSSGVNNTTALNAPVGDITKVFGNYGQFIPVIFLAIVAFAMVIPLIIDMVAAYIIAYKRSLREGKNDVHKPAVGMDGLYRTLMTFGVVLLSGIVLLYLLSLITVYNNSALIETLRNLSTILGTGLATIIAFYFGMRGSQSAVENTVKRLSSSKATKDLTIPSVLKTKPIDGENNVHINTNIYAKFNEPMDPSSINKTTFTIVNSNNNKPVDGKISLIENNTKGLFDVSELINDTKYSVTIESEVTDIEGNHMMNNKVWSFTTGEKEPDIEPQSKMPQQIK